MKKRASSSLFYGFKSLLFKADEKFKPQNVAEHPDSARWYKSDLHAHRQSV